MNMSKNKTNRFMPFIMAFCVVIGIIIGTFFSNHFSIFCKIVSRHTNVSTLVI